MIIISWNTTRKCNQFCAHCYRDAGPDASEHELTTDEGFKLLDDIKKAGFRIMVLSGGEPLVRPDMLDLVKHGADIGLRVVLGTNGTLLTPEWIENLKEAGCARVGISLDSCEASIHDEFRRMPGAWETTVNAMNDCKRLGMPFQMHTTVTERNYDEIVRMTDLAVELGAAAHHVFFLVPTGRGTDIEQETIKASQYEKLLNDICKKQQEVDIELKPTCAPHFMRIAKRREIPMRFTKGCLAGTHYCVITPDGDVHPCPYLPIKVGNVHDKPFDEIWDTAPLFHELREADLKGRCGSCDCADICGGCRARAYYYNDGDYMAEEPWCLYRPAESEASSVG